MHSSAVDWIIVVVVVENCIARNSSERESEREREKVNPILGLMKVANVIWIIVDSFLHVRVCCEW